MIIVKIRCLKFLLDAWSNTEINKLTIAFYNFKHNNCILNNNLNKILKMKIELEKKIKISRLKYL